MVALTRLLSAAFFFVAALAVTDTPGFEAVQKAAGKTRLQVGNTYAFRSGPKIGHTRLIVGTVVINDHHQRDFDANMFELLKDAKTRVEIVRGAQCLPNSKEGWDCSKPQKWKYLGQTQDLHFAHIDMRNDQLIVDNQCYNVVTNSCQTQVKRLFKQIKARSLMLEARDALGEEYVMVKRDGLIEAGLLGDSNLGLHARDVLGDDFQMIARDAILDTPNLPPREEKASFIVTRSADELDVRDAGIWEDEMDLYGRDFDDEDLLFAREYASPFEGLGLSAREVYAY